MDNPKQILKRIVELTGYTLVKKRSSTPQNSLPLTKRHFLDLYFSLVKDPFFVEVGANNGYTGDPIHPFITKYNLRGICVEPQPDVFKKLQETYREYPNVKCISALIGEKLAPFYVIKEKIFSENDWMLMSGAFSFNKEILKGSLKKKIQTKEILPLVRLKDLEDYIQEVVLPLISFAELIKDLKKIDVLVIDAEGYDYEILKTLDFKRFDPQIINLESRHFSDKTREECERLLTNNGYYFFRDKSDTCAYKMKEID